MDLGAPGLRLGSDWAQIEHNGSKVWYLESLWVPPGCILGGLGSSLIAFRGHSVSICMTWASKIDAGGDQADIAKAIQNPWFSDVLEG